MARSVTRPGLGAKGGNYSRTFTVIGDQELEAKLNNLSSRAAAAGARKAVRAGSTPMLQGMRGAIPRGPTGNLRKALRRKINRNAKMAGNPYTANVFIAAQHAYLVRFGTKGPRKVKKKRVMSNANRGYAAKGFIQRGRGGIAGDKAGYHRLRRAHLTGHQTMSGTFFGKEVAKMPANPFFTRVYEAHKQQFLDQAERVMREAIDATGKA